MKVVSKTKPFLGVGPLVLMDLRIAWGNAPIYFPVFGGKFSNLLKLLLLSANKKKKLENLFLGSEGKKVR
jgi:hypothetical protein